MHKLTAWVRNQLWHLSLSIDYVYLAFTVREEFKRSIES
jgi:hypothetical protein